MLRNPGYRWPKLLIAIALPTLLGVLGCDKHHQSLAGIGAGNLPPGRVGDPCASHQTGCSCDQEGETVACGSVKQTIDNYVICSEGVRTCNSGQWGECVADHEEKKPLVYRAPMQGGYTAQALGSSTSCNDLCDPGCQKFVDDANGVSVDVDLSAGPDGITLPGSPGGSGGMACNMMQLTPKTKTVTISSIAALTGSTVVDGTITANPAGSNKVDIDATCAGGTTTEPSWTLDSYDRATVSAHGVVTVYSGVAGPITVTGQGPSNSDTAVITVVDVIGDTPIAAGTTADPGSTLYPYNNTLFPLGLKAPLVQWTEGGITPTKTQVMLCYPKNTCASFQYVATWPSSSTSTTLNEPRDGALDTTVPAWQIPQQIWSAFDRTAAGNTGQIIIRRTVGSTKYKQLSIDVQFATDALRGTVYYTQYLRALHTGDSTQSYTYSSTSYAPGQTCQVGNNTHPSSSAGSQTRAIDLSSYAASNTDPFSAGGSTAGCPVCHSVSADGSTAVSGGSNWQTSSGGNGKGIDTIGLNSSNVPAFTGVFDAPNYSGASSGEGSGTSEDSRGFSYAAITPDGGLVLQGSNFWGSTTSTPTQNNTQNANFTGVTNQLKPYFFVDTKTPNPGFGVQFATTGALPANYTASGSGSTLTLTAPSGGSSLTIDGQTMAANYSLLVKDETGTNAKYNGVYTVSTASPWKLKVRSDAYSTTSFKPQSEVRITDGNLNRTNVYYVSSPASGTITPGSTALTFSQRVYPPMVFGSSPHSTDYATTAALGPGTVTLSTTANTLTTNSLSALVVDGHTMALNETVLVKDQVATTQNGTYKLTTVGAGGTGTPTGVSYATTGALPSNTLSGGVLTGTAPGPLPTIDGITPASGDTLLVKDEGNGASNGIYTLTTVGVKGNGPTLTAALCGSTAALPAYASSSNTLTASGYGALPSSTFDGCALATSNRLLVKNESASQYNGVYTVTSLGTGNASGTPHATAKYGTIAALPANTASGGVLTGVAWGPLANIDGQAAAVNDRVVVMNETTAANNGIYVVTGTGTGTSNVHTAVRLATTASLPTYGVTATILNPTNYGALQVDGVAPALGDRILVKNEVTQTNNGIYTVTATGLGTGAPHTAARAATTAALPANTGTTGVLTGSTYGPFPTTIDGVTLAVNDRVLVKNETNAANNGIYQVTSLGTGNGTIHTASKAATIGSLPANTNTAGVLTATSLGPLGTIDGVTVGPTDRVLVKNEANTVNNGVYTVTSVGMPGTVHTSVLAATTASLPTYSISTNVLTSTTASALNIDGVTFTGSGTERVLVKNETNQIYNGIYVVTNAGASGTAGTTHTAAKAATTAALPTFNNVGGVLTASVGGPFPQIDGVTIAVSTDRVLVKDETNAANNGIYTLTSAGLGKNVFPANGAVDAATTGTALSASPFSATWSNTNHTYTGTSSTLTLDGVTLGSGDRVLVKDETTATRNGIFTVGSSGGKWRLSRASDATGTQLSAGEQVYVGGGTANGGKTYYISSPTGTVTVDSSSITFSISTPWSLTRATDANTSANLKPLDAVSITAGTTNTGATFYISSPAAGNTITINTTPIVWSPTAKWVLTRATDADGPGDLTGGDQVPVTGGSVNINAGFYISSPAAGAAVTVNTTPMAWNAASKWVLTRAGDSISGGDQFPVSPGGTNGNLTFYVTTPASGAAVLNTSSIVFSQSTPWTFTRVADADQTNELNPGDVEPVTNGLLYGGQAFYVSSPASGTITINSTPIGWNQSAKWQLTRALDTYAPGDQVPITEGTVNAGTTYYLSIPTSGLIVPGVTAISFSLSSKWSLTRATDADTTGELNPGDLVAVSNGGTNAGKTFYVSTPASGTITINTTAIGFTQASKWVLTRATDADQASELLPGLQVPVTSGPTNGGSIYYISAPASGTVTVNSTPITFSVEVPWQLTRKSPYTAAGGGLVPGLQVQVSNGSTNGSKTYFISSPSSGSITVDSTSITFTLGVAWQLTRTADADTTGEITPGMEVKVANGTSNGGRVFYVASPTNGSIAINTTGITFSYGLPSMMAPVMSPDGKKVAYVNGDPDVSGGLTETGWRRGLSMFSFDQTTMTLSSKKRLINNWNATTPGTAVKWPFFEGDSRSLLYVETSPNEYCSAAANTGTCASVTNDTNPASVTCSSGGSTLIDTNIERACYQAAYGSMSPTTRGYWPGRIYSIDTNATTPSSTRAELATLDNAEDTSDAGKAYQPTVLPFTAGGKRWVIFTSPRAYGNQFNQKSSTGTPTDLSCAASMLWVAAIDDVTANGTDRSHQAFFMPGQQVAKITASTHYVNERGYLVPSPCKANGVSCSVDEECCGAKASPATAACRVPAGWDPSTGAPAKTCQALSGTCSTTGQTCSVDADCCGGASCVNFTCGAPGMQYVAATFTREYVASCPTGQLPVWTLYSYHLSTPGNSQLVFSAQSSNDLGTLDAATVVSLGSSTGDTASPMAAETIDVGAKLDAAKISKNLVNLRILVKLVPSTDGVSAPILKDWTMNYTCTDSL